MWLENFLIYDMRRSTFRDDDNFFNASLRTNNRQEYFFFIDNIITMHYLDKFLFFNNM
jgi:hypothetical protein